MDFKISRRAALGAFIGGGAAACRPRGPATLNSSERSGANGTFEHGVASGDPLSDRVIIWTRITPALNMNSASVEWQVSNDKNFDDIVSSGNVQTSPAKDWTVKIDADGLSPNSWYYYRFKSQEGTSPIGKTRTLPDGKVNKARFAVVSCANWQHGYFNPYDHIARDGGFDALLHLGDYLYEYGIGGATDAMTAAGRLHEPRHEILTLQDYRTRHGQYRTDPSLQAITAQMPMIAIWDDHESSNDSWKDGAGNHQEGEGNWNSRKEIAMRAYYEWMPVRDPKPGTGLEFLFRSFEWGELATLAAVETRLMARSESFEFEPFAEQLFDPEGLEKFKAEKWFDPAREMMGKIQVDWLVKTFGQSKKDGKPWRLLVNQVLLSRTSTPDTTPHITDEDLKKLGENEEFIRLKRDMSPLRLPMYPDSWDGYPAARERLFNALKGTGVEDMLVVTGDSHEFWANDITADNGENVGVEIGTTSVSSITSGDFIGDPAEQFALLVNKENRDVRYYNPLYKGYVDLTLTPSKATARMIAVDSVDSPEYTAFRAAEFEIKPSGDSLKFDSAEGLTPTQQLLFRGLV
ncbi:MAG: alkaline phosphatase [Hellea sp.]|nr:alkaline phosphatase [Hellea sp.]